jgi:hypothetical protein
MVDSSVVVIDGDALPEDSETPLDPRRDVPDSGGMTQFSQNRETHAIIDNGLR